MTIIRRVERCPDHDIPAEFLLTGTMYKPEDGIKATSCPVVNCRNHGLSTSTKDGFVYHVRLPVVDPPEVVVP